ncbi:hypothetical protein F511_21267 [Dorcoceras hygrometricum]|uniref:Uncharacterized protein n=1 Tax=Dorcoceras hygrometricum TaxID=472368 RepID=A0A2Z7AXW7_9LAMI|nr:hypothetical protein F511_21267 [Dorcoceras hygrometricum]
METGIDQLNLHFVQLGYLKILQMGNADPNNTKLENNTSKSASGNHQSVIFRVHQPITARWYSDTTNQSVTTPMIALDYSGTTPQLASHNMALISGHKSINLAQDIPQRHDNTNNANQLSPDILNHGRSCPEPQIC